MKAIVTEPDRNASNLELLRFRGITDELREQGYSSLVGLPHWHKLLNPVRNSRAWSALKRESIASRLHAHPLQSRSFTLNDEGTLNKEPQLAIQFQSKKTKSHLTIVEGCKEEIYSDLPPVLQVYLSDCLDFVSEARDDLNAILPPSSLPTILSLRIFQYDAVKKDDAGLSHGMRPHVDGSVLTLIIAESDFLFHFWAGHKWHPACRNGGKPFAIVLPGIAARHDFSIRPTPHRVLPSVSQRTSVTLALTPLLGESRLEAEKAFSSWRLAPSQLPRESILN